MTAVAIVFLVISVVLVWGGLASSVAFLSARPEVAEYPEGGKDSA